MTPFVSGDNVTVPVPWSTRPAEVVAMLSTKDGNWKSTGPDGGWPRRVSVTDWPLDEILRLSLRPSVVGKLVTEIGGSPLSHRAGTPRPTTRSPSVRWATSEASSTPLAWDIPQAWGEAPCPVAGCRPSHGVWVEGADELSHHEYGPL